MSRQRIRVLHVIGTAEVGGVQSFVLNLAPQIDCERFELTVCVTGNDGVVGERLRELGIEVVVLRAKPFDLAAMARFSRLLGRRFEIVHLHVGGRAVSWLTRLLHRGARITHLHGYPEDYLRWVREGRRPPQPRPHARPPAKPHSIIACSASAARMISPAPAARVHVVHCGIDLDRFDAKRTMQYRDEIRHRMGIGPQQFALLFIGRLVRQKGIDKLVEVAKRLDESLPSFHLVVIGDGPDRHRLEELVSRLGERVHLVGERIDTERWLAACDALVCTSEWESFGIVLAEAMAASRPVASFAVDAVPEVVPQGEAGVLVPPGDAVALAASVLSLAGDDEARQRMGSFGRAHAERLFSMRAMAHAIEQEYEAVIYKSGA